MDFPVPLQYQKVALQIGTFSDVASVPGVTYLARGTPPRYRMPRVLAIYRPRGSAQTGFRS